MAQISSKLNTVEINSDTLQSTIDMLFDIGGGDLYLDAQTYSLTTDLIIPNNVRIVGIGSSGTIIDFNNTSSQVQIVGSDVYTTGTISITSGTDTVTGSGTTWTSDMIGRSIILSQVLYTISDVPTATTITLETAYSGTSLTGSTYSLFNPASSASISGITIQNSTIEGLKVQYAYNFNADDITVDSCGTGFDFDSVYIFTYNRTNSNNNTNAGSISNSSFATVFNFGVFGCSEGVTCTDFNNSIVFDISVDTITVGNGFTFNNVTNFGLSQSSISNIAGIGIDAHSFNGSSTCAVQVETSTLQNCGLDGIRLSDYISGFVVSGGSPIQNNIGYGINIDSTCTNNLINGNVFSNNTSGAVHDLGVGTLIRSNIGLSDN